MDVVNALILTGALLLIASIFTSLVSFRFGAPLLLVFLLVGLAAGEDGLGIQFDSAPTAFFIGSLALAVILFDSGFQTPLSTWRAAAWPAVTLATAGVVMTTGLLGVAAWLILDLSWSQSLLLAAIVSSTDAAAVFFLLRVGGITLREKVRATLEVESGSNDPMAILLTLGLVEAVRLGSVPAAEDWLLLFVQQMGGGALLGLAGGLALVQAVNRLKIDRGLHPVVALAFALLVFAATNVLGGSGFLAVYVAGLIAGNTRLEGAPMLRRFQSGLTWLSQIFMFVTLGLLATPSRFPALMAEALALAAVLILLARPLAVWACLLPFGFSRRETAFVAWVGLRGAVSILLALVPVLGGVDETRMIFDVVFMMVVVSLVVQGWTIGPVARWLRLVVPPRAGPAERIELELPGGAALVELVVYTLGEGCPVTRGQRVPRWARPALILRGGQCLNIHSARQLQPGDRVYLFAAPAQIPLLDQLFAGTRELAADDPGLWGDFALSPDTTLGWVAEMYGQPLDIQAAGRSLRELFQQEYRGGVEAGDRIALGSVDLIARSVEGGAVTEIGLALESRPPPRRNIPLFQNAGEIRAALARLATRWRERRRKGGRPLPSE